MPVQQQMSDFAKGLGARLAKANAESIGKPIDLGGRKQLPPNIKDGVAKLSTMYTKKQESDDGACPKGMTFFRASAIVVSPAECAGAVTQFIVPICDVPAKGQRKAKSLEENWNRFRSLLEEFGVKPPVEPGEDEAAGLRIQAYYFTAMKALVEPTRLKTNPIFISFSTRGWTPPPTAQQPKPTEMVFEDWNGLAKTAPPRPDPAAGVGTQPHPMSAPPSSNGVPQQQQPTPPAHDPAADYADVVEVLVQTATNDPEGATTEGADAAVQLQEMAWKVGWTEEQTKKADDWSAVGDMALNPPTTQPAPDAADVTVGSKWLFKKRSGKDGATLKDGNGNEFPAQEVEVVTVDAAAKTCTLKTVKDQKSVVDIRSKKPVEARFEWLERGQPY